MKDSKSSLKVELTTNNSDCTGEVENVTTDTNSSRENDGKPVDEEPPISTNGTGDRVAVVDETKLDVDNGTPTTPEVSRPNNGTVDEQNVAVDDETKLDVDNGTPTTPEVSPPYNGRIDEQKVTVDEETNPDVDNGTPTSPEVSRPYSGTVDEQNVAVDDVTKFDVDNGTPNTPEVSPKNKDTVNEQNVAVDDVTKFDVDNGTPNTPEVSPSNNGRVDEQKEAVVDETKFDVDNGSPTAPEVSPPNNGTIDEQNAAVDDKTKLDVDNGKPTTPEVSRPNNGRVDEQKFKDVLQEIQMHHKQTGCNGLLEPYSLSGKVAVGAFCPSCKEEWLLEEWLQEFPDIKVASYRYLKQVAHHYVPTFCCLQVSDTGHYVRMTDIGKLKRGDHVAWRRPLPYWHHGIVTNDVQKGADELSVIEYSKVARCKIEIKEETKDKTDVIGCCCCSQMYKVVYPKEIEDQNPPDLVMLRARKMENLSEKKEKGYSPFFDNCEHFATFCKTGSHKCNQLFQYRSKLSAWVTRVAVAFLYVVFVVFFAETIEFLVPTIDEDYLAVIVLSAFEFLYWVIIIVITYRHDTHREGFKKKDKKKNDEIIFRRSCTSACKRAVVKSGLQSFTFVGFVALFGIGGVRLIGSCRVNYIDQWSVQKRISIEMAMGILGGILGSVFGYCLFQLIPYPCCRTNIGEDEESRKGEGQERQDPSEGGTHVHEEKRKTGGIELERPTETKDFEV